MLSDAISFIDSTRVVATNSGKVIAMIDQISVRKVTPKKEDMKYRCRQKKYFLMKSPFKCACTIRALTKFCKVLR